MLVLTHLRRLTLFLSSALAEAQASIEEGSDSCQTTEAVSSVTEPCTSDAEPGQPRAPDVHARSGSETEPVSTDSRDEGVCVSPEVKVDQSLLTAQHDIVMTVQDVLIGHFDVLDQITRPRQKRSWRIVKSKAKWPPWLVGTARRGTLHAHAHRRTHHHPHTRHTPTSTVTHAQDLTGGKWRHCTIRPARGDCIAGLDQPGYWTTVSAFSQVRRPHTYARTGTDTHDQAASSRSTSWCRITSA